MLVAALQAIIFVTAGTLCAQTVQPLHRTHFCKTLTKLTSAELEKRVVHHEPLRVFNYADIHIAPESEVRLKVSISPQGTVECVSLIHGHPILASGAIDSVR